QREQLPLHVPYRQRDRGAHRKRRPARAGLLFIGCAVGIWLGHRHLPQRQGGLVGSDLRQHGLGPLSHFDTRGEHVQAAVLVQLDRGGRRRRRDGTLNNASNALASQPSSGRSSRFQVPSSRRTRSWGPFLLKPGTWNLELVLEPGTWNL